MASVGEIGFEQILAMGGVEAAERHIDRDRQLASTEAGESPQESDRQKLFFSG